MATLKDFRESYYELSGIASEVSRKLGYAGIALIWIFKSDVDEGTYSVVPDLYYAGLAIVLSLALDLLQYILGSLVWGVFWRKKEKSGADDSDELTAPSWLNWPAIGCFWAKLVFMLLGYGLLLNFLASRITVG